MLAVVDAIFNGNIATKTSDQRRELFRRLIDDVFLPQRRRLVGFRHHTWQSAFVDDDGYLAELIGSIVIGIPGVNRRGVSTSTGDLADGTEVKKAYRLDPNIDFVLAGDLRASGRELFISNLPDELRSAHILAQINANASSLQLLRRDAIGLLVPSDDGISLTASKDAYEPDGKSGYLKLGRSRPAAREDGSVSVCIRQERGHINFGRRSRAQLDAILRSKPILVFYQHDRRGRCQIAVVRSMMSDASIRNLLDTIYDENSAKRQCQPYLFPDNVRDALARSEKHSVVALDGRLLAFGVESADGFQVQHWAPDGRNRVSEMEQLLTQLANIQDCPPFSVEPALANLTDEEGRRCAASIFYRTCMAGYYDALEPYCRVTQTTRNIGFGNLSQHLVSITAGLRGTRSGARGADIIERNGDVSEVKLATGQPNDIMGTEDNPRLTLGWDEHKMLSWRRLFPVRIVDEGQGLRVLVHAPTDRTMKTFRSQLSSYFAGRSDNGSGGLQYHTNQVREPFPHDAYGRPGRKLDFARVADLGPNGYLFPEAFPAVKTTKL